MHTTITTGAEVNTFNIANPAKLKTLIDNEAQQSLDAKSIDSKRHADILSQTQKLPDELKIIADEKAAQSKAKDADKASHQTKIETSQNMAIVRIGAI